MTRYRWFRLGLPTSFHRFTKRIERTPMAPGAEFGFVQMESRNDRRRFRHLQRSKVSIAVLDAEGNSTQQVIDSVESVEFEAFEAGDVSFLRMDAPPRSARGFFNSLEQISGLGFSAEPVVFGAKQQRAVLRRVDTRRMTALKGLGNDISAKLVARIEIASKEGLEPEKLGFLSGLGLKIDHSTFEVTYEMLKGQITFAASGQVRIGGPLEPYLLACIESWLIADARE